MAADRIWAAVGDLDAFYYGAAADGFIPAVELTLERAQALLPLGLYALLVLVREFLPAMLVRGDGAILSAQGASALQGRPNIAGGFALAVQRNYLQSLHAAVADKGVYVGGLYIGAAIEHSRFHTEREAAKAAGATIPEMPTVDPHHLADLLWTLHGTRSRPEATYPNDSSTPRSAPLGAGGTWRRALPAWRPWGRSGRARTRPPASGRGPSRRPRGR
jgi:short-subunit dehydrogenase